MENDKKAPNQDQINIELSDDVGLGIYSNLVIISHSTSEFVVDFIRVMPNMPKAKVMSRVILTPEHAKGLQVALEENIRKYEAYFGAIKKTENGTGFIPPVIGFGGGQA
ncbi:MAG: DUF3467 domain-containing protein [Bacteroidales bacterium]|jgi:hypothetical protein|nr:DUF3467 domain-containing protein [Bacteroidales bacterium]